MHTTAPKTNHLVFWRSAGTDERTYRWTWATAPVKSQVESINAQPTGMELGMEELKGTEGKSRHTSINAVQPTSSGRVQGGSSRQSGKT